MQFRFYVVQDVYGQLSDNTFEESASPSLTCSKKIADVDPEIKATVQNLRTVRRFIKCVECGKPRVSNLSESSFQYCKRTIPRNKISWALLGFKVL